jgi:hypothetical protein
MTPLLLALALAADPAVTPPPLEPTPGPTRLQVVGATLALEGIILLNSGLAANSPRSMGWVLVGMAPLAPVLGSGPAPVRVAGGLVLGSIGLYNLLELRGARYTPGGRFWRNLAAWHLGAGAMALTSLAAGPGEADPGAAGPGGAPALAIGFTAGGGAGLLLSGRY